MGPREGDEDMEVSIGFEPHTLMHELAAEGYEQFSLLHWLGRVLGEFSRGLMDGLAGIEDARRPAIEDVDEDTAARAYMERFGFPVVMHAGEPGYPVGETGFVETLVLPIDNRDDA